MTPRKKVLILGKLPPPYMGPSVAFEILINSGLKNYYDLLYLDIKANASLETLGKWSFKKLFTNISIYKKFYFLLRNEKPDVVLIPVSQATIGFVKDSVFIILCHLTKTKCLVQLRGSDIQRWLGKAAAITRWYVHNVLITAKGALVLGHKLKYLFEPYFSKEKIFVVPNGGNYIITPVIKTNNDRVRIIYLANLQPSKGIEDVLDAIYEVEKIQPGSCELNVIGAWRKEETKQKCIDFVNKNSLPVVFLPSVSGKNKFEYLTKSDIFVFTPREPEGHPWVIIEAMAAGLPIITTDQGAITESVADGKNGYIVPSKNPPAIAEKIISLINNPALRQKMGNSSRALYEEKFTEAQMVNNYIKAFDSVINESAFNMPFPVAQDEGIG